MTKEEFKIWMIKKDGSSFLSTREIAILYAEDENEGLKLELKRLKEILKIEESINDLKQAKIETLQEQLKAIKK